MFLADDYCKKFVAGDLCGKVNMYTPKSFCKEACKGDYKKWVHKEVDKQNFAAGEKLEVQKPIEPTIKEMSKTFGRAMAGWAKSGFKLVSKVEYFKRRLICAKCEERVKGRCSKCGCNLKMKLALATEKCPMNYWKEI